MSEGIKGSAAYVRLVEQERLMAEAAELVETLLAKHSVHRIELAQRMGTARSHITHLLSGQRNLTLQTLAEMCFVLGYRVKLTVEPLAPYGHTASGEPITDELIEQRAARFEAAGGESA